MSLQWQLPRQVPADTARTVQALLSEESVYRVIGERFDELFPDESVFAAMYASTGRGAISPLLLALVTVLQHLEKVPDRRAAEFAVVRLDWKYALHLGLDYDGFDFTALHYFRKRLKEHV